MVVRLEGQAAAELRRLAANAYPHEGCGVLIGTAHGRSEIDVVEATPGRNLRIDRAGDRYELDPGDIVAAERSARERALEVVGFWHSHPDAPARPSHIDTGRAWPDYAYIIVATSTAGPGDLRAWILDEGTGAFGEVAVGPIGETPAGDPTP